MARVILPHAPGVAMADTILAVGEIAYDETDKSIRLGDGITLGGTTASNTSLSVPLNPAPTQLRVLIRRATDGAPLVRQRSRDEYDGTGIGTSGAGTLVIGTRDPIVQSTPGTFDDSAVLICRDVKGTNLFSHAFRDESSFESEVDGAYASYDTFLQIGGDIHYNHFRGYQARMRYAGTGIVDEYNSFGSAPVVVSGSIPNLYDFAVAQGEIAPGVVGNRFGLYMAPLTGAETNVSIFVQNDCYLLGNVQIAGRLTGVTSITMSDQFTAGKSIHAGPGISEYRVGGGVMMGSDLTASGYGAVQSYSWDGATLGTLGLALQPNGGQVLIGAGSPVTGKTLEVVGSFSAVTSAVSEDSSTRTILATGTPADYKASGGALLLGQSGGSGYGGLEAYSDATGAPKGLVLNARGGQVMVGGNGDPVTGAKLEVSGDFSATTARLTSLPVFEDNTEAAALAVGAVYRTAAGVLMVRY